MQTITIKLKSDNERSVRGYVSRSGLLGAHRCINPSTGGFDDPSRIHSKHRRYTVTHLPTGFSLFRQTVPRAADAVKIMDALDHLDWNFSTRDPVHKKELHESVRSIIDGLDQDDVIDLHHHY